MTRRFPRCTQAHPTSNVGCIRKRGHNGMHYTGGVYWDTELEANPRIRQYAYEDAVKTYDFVSRYPILDQVVIEASNEQLVQWLWLREIGGRPFSPEFLMMVRTELLKRLQHGGNI